jgi:DNA-directed RNA polymerase specialized sigma24 family protein
VIETVGPDCTATVDCVTLAVMSTASVTLDQVFREEYGRIIATLIRISGSFDLAEEALQDAFAAAVTHWKTDGPPRNPGADHCSPPQAG